MSIRCQEGHDSLARVLLDHGADFSQTYCGYRPYDAAKKNGHEGIARLIVDETTKKKKLSKRNARASSLLGF